MVAPAHSTKIKRPRLSLTRSLPRPSAPTDHSSAAQRTSLAAIPALQSPNHCALNPAVQSSPFYPPCVRTADKILFVRPLARIREADMWGKGPKDWGQRRTLLAAVLLVMIPSLIAIFVAPFVPDELRKALYAGAVTLFFAGLLGGMLKVLLDDVAAAKRKREDAATFVINVLADLKSVYDRVARARVLIPAHKSVKTYGEEMRRSH